MDKDQIETEYGQQVRDLFAAMVTNMASGVRDADEKFARGLDLLKTARELALNVVGDKQ